MTGKIVQVSISPGGVPKRAILEGYATRLGLEGDRHNNTRFHGGPNQALLLIAAEDMDALRGEGWPLFYGALGENLTTSGIDFRQMRLGQRYLAGEALIEITKVRQPCGTLSPYGVGIQDRVYDAAVKAGDVTSPKWGLAGFYAAVREPGAIRPNDIIRLLDHVV
jgi:MOSC domain-containing protein YiiM